MKTMIRTLGCRGAAVRLAYAQTNFPEVETNDSKAPRRW
jgi:hypothetical protein